MLGIALTVPSSLDTDSFGSFDGKVPRITTAAETAIAKARAGMAAAGLTLGIASEGSFGPHPVLVWVPAGIETMVFIDAEMDLTVSETRLCERTNFSHRDVADAADLADWLVRIGFPTHGLLVRPLGGPVLAKGITDRASLSAVVAQAAARGENGLARVETDMRAHLNPTRMASIRGLAVRLARRLATACPACAAPGWGQTGVVRGLTCAGCGGATNLVAALVFGCGRCRHSHETPRPDGRRTTDPGNCPNCNP